MSLEQAREFLAKVVPWPQDGEEGYVNIHFTHKEDKYPKPQWRGSPCRSVSEAIKAIEYAQARPETRDLYVCMSLQRQREEKISKTGKTFYTAVRNQENALSLKALFLDIDVKEGAYGSLVEATAALGVFCKAIDLPRPTVLVSTGGGAHAHWALADALTPEEWRPLAYALVEAAKRHGLKFDAGCSIDSARVLRIPGSVNCKQEVRRPVRLVGPRQDFSYSVERIARVLEPYKVAVPQAAAPKPDWQANFPPGAPLTTPNELSAGVQHRGAVLINLDAVASECPFVNDAITSGGKNLQNPLWNITTLISTFTQGGRADAHRMGCGHSSYTPESTDELFDRKSTERQSRNIGYPSCAAISASGSKHCQTCKHFAAGKSPLNFQAKSQAPTTPLASQLPPGAPSGTQSTSAPVSTVSVLPKGYQREPNGIITRGELLLDGTTDYKAVCNYPMSNPWMTRDPYTLHFETEIEAGKHKTVSVPAIETVSIDLLRKCLFAQGMTPYARQGKALEEFFVAWMDTLKHTKGAIVNSSPFGWVEKHGVIEGFCYGGEVWTPNGSRKSAHGKPVIGKQYAPSGSITPWNNLVAMILAQGRPEVEAILASAFGAPLVHFTGMKGLLLSAYSPESACGKTTVMEAAQAVWGSPVSAMQGLDDTITSVVGKLGDIRNLPMYWDEIKTEEDTLNFCKIVFKLSGGRDKMRMNSKAEILDTSSWQTMMISASNDSIIDFVLGKNQTNIAGLMRVFEYEVSKPAPDAKGQIGMAQAMAMSAGIRSNYGHAGLEYAKFLGSNSTRLHTEVYNYFDHILKLKDSKQEERQWFATIAVVVMGATYANEIGLTTIDVPALEEFMFTKLVGMRKERKIQKVGGTIEMNISDTLNQFLSAMRMRHTLHTNRINVGSGRPVKGAIKVIKDASKLDGLYVQIGMDDKLMRFSSTALTNWLNDAGYKRHEFMKQMQDKFGMKDIKGGYLGSGTDFANLAKEYLYEIDLNHPEAKKFIGE